MTNFSMRYTHSVLYAIARTVPYGLNISSSYFLANMNKKRFKKSLERWNSFIEAVDLEDAFDGFKVKGRDMELLHIARVLGRGCLNTGTLVGQVLHWFYVGAPRATTSYRACINVLLSSNKLHIEILNRLIDTHGKLTVFDRCTYRSAKEATQNYTLLEADFKSISDKLVIKAA